MTLGRTLLTLRDMVEAVQVELGVISGAQPRAALPHATL